MNAHLNSGDWLIIVGYLAGIIALDFGSAETSATPAIIFWAVVTSPGGASAFRLSPQKPAR